MRNVPYQTAICLFLSVKFNDPAPKPSRLKELQEVSHLLSGGEKLAAS
jgi:hypothetical protein